MRRAWCDRQMAMSPLLSRARRACLSVSGIGNAANRLTNTMICCKAQIGTAYAPSLVAGCQHPGKAYLHARNEALTRPEDPRLPSSPAVQQLRHFTIATTAVVQCVFRDAWLGCASSRRCCMPCHARKASCTTTVPHLRDSGTIDTKLDV